MIGEEGKDRAIGDGHRRTFSRSVSWTDRSPATRKPPPASNKSRPLPPPLQLINRRSFEGWPSAASDDLGVWTLAQTPRGSTGSSDSGQPGKEFEFKRDKLAFYDKECSRIADHVYLGSDTVAKNHELLRQNGITHVLNCVGFVCPEYFKRDFVYKTLWLKDSPSEDITSILYDVFDYFEDVREQGGRVLVHCCQGISRSTCLVIAYLMWRESRSFEDAFQFVKNARGVTNPNMGFACQLLQCQKRVHSVPASPNSILRMYRMAPHSPYDPLHLVPKMVTHQPFAQALDSRGAFIVHVPSAIYVWTGKNCNSVMSSNARAAAFQVIRYEKATGPIRSIHEDEEPPEFWIALSSSEQQMLSSGNSDKVLPNSECVKLDDGVFDMGVIRPKKVDEYDLDYEIFHKALAGGVVPPFSVSVAGSETCLPARENGWGRLRRKLASGIMKGFFTASKRNDEQDIIKEEEQNQLSAVDSPDSFECFPVKSSVRELEKDNVEVLEDHFIVPSVVDSSLPPSPPPGTTDSFPCFLSISPKFGSKSSTLSPSSSDYASSLTFSPSSTNRSDLSFLSSQQPSPPSLEPTESFPVKESPSLLHKEAVVFSSSDACLANPTFGGANSYLPCKTLSSPSLAERRGSNPPPRMLLPSVNEPSQAQKILVRSQSFSLPELDDDLMKGVSCKQSDREDSGK